MPTQIYQGGGAPTHIYTILQSGSLVRSRDKLNT